MRLLIAFCLLGLIAGWPAEAQSPAPVPIRAYPGTLADCSATVTLGGTAQVLVAANANRRKLMIENTSTGNIGISFTTATPTLGGTASFTLLPFGIYNSDPEYIPVNAVSVIGATTGQQIVCVQG